METYYEDGTFRALIQGNVVITCWFDAPTVRQLRELENALKAAKAAHPTGAVLINLMHSGRPTFSSEVRAEAARQTADPDPRDLAVAHVVLIDGMVGAAVRTFLSTLMLMARPKTPTKVFGDVFAAAEWMAPRASVGGSLWAAGDLVRLCADARQRQAS